MYNIALVLTCPFRQRGVARRENVLNIYIILTSITPEVAISIVGLFHKLIVAQCATSKQNNRFSASFFFLDMDVRALPDIMWIEAKTSSIVYTAKLVVKSQERMPDVCAILIGCYIRHVISRGVSTAQNVWGVKEFCSRLRRSKIADCDIKQHIKR